MERKAIYLPREEMPIRRAIYIKSPTSEIKRKAIKLPDNYVMTITGKIIQRKAIKLPDNYTVSVEGKIVQRKAIKINRSTTQVSRPISKPKPKSTIKRKAIYLPIENLGEIKRTPIVFLKKTQKYWEDYNNSHPNIPMYFIQTTLEYYEAKVRQAINLGAYRYMSKSDWENKKGRKWIQLCKFCKFVKEHNFDPRIYIDSQFERLENWKHKQKYPYFEQMYSDMSVKAYESYIHYYKASRSLTEDVKVKPLISVVEKSERADIIKALIRDCRLILDYVENTVYYKRLNNLTPVQRELTYMIDHPVTLSKYFWSNVYWSTDLLGTYEDKCMIQLCREVYEIQQSPARMELIGKLVISIKRKMGVPLLDEDFM